MSLLLSYSLKRCASVFQYRRFYPYQVYNLINVKLMTMSSFVGPGVFLVVPLFGTTTGSRDEIAAEPWMAKYHLILVELRIQMKPEKHPFCGTSVSCQALWELCHRCMCMCVCVLMQLADHGRRNLSLSYFFLEQSK